MNETPRRKQLGIQSNFFASPQAAGNVPFSYLPRLSPRQLTADMRALVGDYLLRKQFKRRKNDKKMDNIVFGIRPVFEAIEAGREIEKVYMRKGAEGQLLSELREVCRDRRLPVQEVPVEKLNRLTRGNHQGVVAQMAAIEYVELADILESIPAGDAALLVMLDGVTDVRNFGAIARSAECAGAHGIIVSSKNAAPVNSDALKTSAGALSRIPVCRTGSLRNALKALQAEGIGVAAATEKGDTVLYDADLKGPLVIVMGNEEKGVSQEILKMCDLRLAIPQRGAIGSLNVSAATAVLLFETLRQRG